MAGQTGLQTQSMVRERAGQAGRLLWGAAVVVATIGGVLGVVQFFSGSGAADSAEAPEAMVLRMVDEGDLDADQAASLMALLGNDMSGEASAALASGSDRKIEALQLVAVAPTFERGIAMLEEDAASAADWRLIAELSQGRDPERALEAARPSPLPRRISTRCAS